MEDPFIHLINKHLLNVFSEPGSRHSAEVTKILLLHLYDLTFNEENILVNSDHPL